MYLRLGWLESAVWAYERAEKYDEAAEIYERLYEKERDAYYLKKAHELWKKAGNMERAVKCLEKYAKEEPWFWEDVGKIYQKLGDNAKAREAYQKFLDYCIKEAENDGMWWKHVAETYEILGEKGRAEEVWKRYEDYRARLKIGINSD